MFNGIPVIRHKLIVKTFFPWKIIRATTHEIQHAEKSFQVATYSTICIGQMQHNDHDVIIVEVTMTRQNL